nr:uncharacterized protein LOC113828874 [Penaeus vannamei]
MNRLKALVAVALAVALAGPGVSAGAAPKLELYTLTNSGGAMFTLTGPHHNLADEGFNDVTRSICGVEYGSSTKTKITPNIRNLCIPSPPRPTPVKTWIPLSGTRCPPSATPAWRTSPSRR